MTAVTPNTRSPMSSYTEHSSEPPISASGANDEGYGQSGNSKRPQDKSKVCDPDFLHNHLRRVPDGSFNQATKNKIQHLVGDIKDNGVINSMYACLAALLTTMSEALYGTLSDAQKNSLHKQHPIPDNKPGHLIFVDHHSSPPTQFPKYAVGCKVEDKPDLLGVYNVDDFDNEPEREPPTGYESHKVYKGIPHHRIIAIVEAKAAKGTEGREQAMKYAFRHHQARPDHPGVFCLSAQPAYYQVIHSDATGVVFSDRISWDNLDLLEAYVYSHYLPPDNHFLWDDTIQWASGDLPTSTPTWKVKVGTQWYIDGELMFVGEAWGRRTTVFSVKDGAKNQVIIKDMFRDDRGMKEEDFLQQVHVDGAVPGVVRMHRCEEVKSGGQVIKCAGQGQRRTKFRLALLDSGSSLLKAKSVNDLLKAVYDALEVHRTLFIERKVLHRDMSVYNILMYPEHNHSGNNDMTKAPTFIGNLLQGTKPQNPVSPACLVIDFDHAAHLDHTDGDMMTERTGTPMFIARSVSLAQTLFSGSVYSGTKMPLLQGEALRLYLKVHGNNHYKQYNDKRGKFHGGVPPKKDPTQTQLAELRAFSHRAEHDVESIYWTLVYALLSVHPKGEPKEQMVSKKSSDIWQNLLTHYIPALDDDNPANDRRTLILDYHLVQWTPLFCSKMKDVAVLLSQISLHVRSEYAMWQGKLQPDHLHEALQRLILQYLVEHRDKDIELDPEIRRPRPNPYASGEDALKPDLRNDLNKGRTSKSRARTGNAANSVGAQSLFQKQGARTGKRTQRTGGGKTGHRNGAINDDQPWAPPARTSAKRKTDELDEPAEGGRKSKRRKTIPDLSEVQDGREHIGNGEQVGSEEHTQSPDQGAGEEHTEGGEQGGSEDSVDGEKGSSEQHTASGEQGQSRQPGISEAATNAAPDQPSTGVRTRSRSKRKSNESDALAEEPRRSKRRKTNPDMGGSKDAGKSNAATGAAAGGSRDEPSAGVRKKSRSKRDCNADKPVERTRSSQRIKDAAAKKASEKKEAEPRPTAKKSVRRTRSRA